MEVLDLALRYMEIFYSGRNIDALRPLLANDFIFEGPFYKFDSADGYLDSLKKDPPINMKYEIIYSFEKETRVCLIYRFSKKCISTIMTQVFEMSGHKIQKIILIFDTNPFKEVGG